jgi:hypothetical protein
VPQLPVSRPGGKTAAAVASPDPESSASEADSSGSGDILEVTEVPAPNGVRPRRAAAQAAGKAISNTYNPGSDPEEEEEAVHGSGSEADEQPEEADPLMLLAKAAETNARAAPPKV